MDTELKSEVAELKAKVDVACDKVARMEEGLKAFLESPQYKAMSDHILYKEQTPNKKVNALDAIR